MPGDLSSLTPGRNLDPRHPGRPGGLVWQGRTPLPALELFPQILAFEAPAIASERWQARLLL